MSTQPRRIEAPPTSSDLDPELNRGYPARPGNFRGLQHGTKSERLMAPRTVEIAEELSKLIPAGTAVDEPAALLLAGMLARIEAANAFIERVGVVDTRHRVRPILKIVAGWEANAARLMDQLGLTPTSRAKLGTELAKIGSTPLAQHLQEKYGGDS